MSVTTSVVAMGVIPPEPTYWPAYVMAVASIVCAFLASYGKGDP